MINIATDPRMERQRHRLRRDGMIVAMVELLGEDCPPMSETKYAIILRGPKHKPDANYNHDALEIVIAENVRHYQEIALGIRKEGFRDYPESDVIQTQFFLEDGSIWISEGTRRASIGLALVSLGELEVIPAREPPPLWIICPSCKMTMEVIENKAGELEPKAGQI